MNYVCESCNAVGPHLDHQLTRRCEKCGSVDVRKVKQEELADPAFTVTDKTVVTWITGTCYGKFSYTYLGEE